MKFIVVTIEWMSAHGLTPLPTMRKSKDGSKVILHEDYFNLIAKKDEEGNLLLDEAEVYAHNSSELSALLNSDEWSYSEEETPAESADFIQVAAVRNLMTATKAGIQTMALTDEESLRVKDMYPEWEPGIDVKEGEKYNSGGKLYKCKLSHKTQEDWKPGSGAYSLWEEVSRHAGTKDDPIPYNEEHDPLFAGMELEQGKYYTQDNITYYCHLGSGQAVYNDLKDLAIYVEPIIE